MKIKLSYVFTNCKKYAQFCPIQAINYDNKAKVDLNKVISYTTGINDCHANARKCAFCGKFLGKTLVIPEKSGKIANFYLK